MKKLIAIMFVVLSTSLMASSTNKIKMSSSVNELAYGDVKFKTIRVSLDYDLIEKKIKEGNFDTNHGYALLFSPDVKIKNHLITPINKNMEKSLSFKYPSINCSFHALFLDVDSFRVFAETLNYSNTELSSDMAKKCMLKGLANVKTAKYFNVFNVIVKAD